MKRGAKQSMEENTEKGKETDPRPAADYKPIQKRQIQLIKIAQKNLGIEDDDYRDLLSGLFGVRSCTALSYGQANRLIKRFRRQGFRPARKQTRRRSIPRDSGNITCLPSRGEISKIAALRRLINWQYQNGFELWLKKRHRINRVKTSGEAYRVIEGLKKMFENQMKKDYGKLWWAGTYDDPAIMWYINNHKR